ncbi:MAG: tRNA (adenosine(37)-N6)-threonylcarbamoyltransferase complex dimerization subunit type 1 TsaB [Calditrichaeota bacterium]|nr:MAG: tRNA (adenosine(37)-N6)-threonylcarbamoyltransferase complex dimerization subunit type 1 TsaB [Calditrichota bacterium]
MEYKNILAIDSSSNRLKIGMLSGGDRVVKIDELVEQSHSQIIIEKINSVFKSSGVDKMSLSAVVVNLGPGSFTGLRIGIAAAKGMVSALGIRIVGINHFEMAAYKLRNESDDIYIIVQFKKDQFFVVPVNSGSYYLQRLEVMKLEHLSDFCKKNRFAIIGLDGQLESGHELDYTNRIMYDASDLLELGTLKLEKGEDGDLAEMEPLYIQKSQAEINFELKNRK